MLAEDAIARTERLLAGKAVLTGAIAQARIDDDVIADRDAADIGADLVDDAGGVRAKNPGRRIRHAGQAGDDEEVEMVERRGAHADAHIRRANHLGNRKIVAILDAIEAAVAGDRQRAHVRGEINSRPVYIVC
jgi:hypothetical protein